MRYPTVLEKPKPRAVRFSIRTLLLLTAAFGLGCWYYPPLVRDFMARRSEINAIRKAAVDRLWTKRPLGDKYRNEQVSWGESGPVLVGEYYPYDEWRRYIVNDSGTFTFDLE